MITEEEREQYIQEVRNAYRLRKPEEWIDFYYSPDGCYYSRSEFRFDPKGKIPKKKRREFRLTKVTRQSIEATYGPVEAQLTNDENGHLIIWTTAYVITVGDYDGMEGLDAVPRHPVTEV